MSAPAKENLDESKAPTPIRVDSRVFCSVFIVGNLLAWLATFQRLREKTIRPNDRAFIKMKLSGEVAVKRIMDGVRRVNEAEEDAGCDRAESQRLSARAPPHRVRAGVLGSVDTSW